MGPGPTDKIAKLSASFKISLVEWLEVIPAFSIIASFVKAYRLPLKCYFAEIQSSNSSHENYPSQGGDSQP